MLISDTPGSSNRLIHEHSPYLLQHAHNPVDWYPWGEAAFSKARREDKLLLISIGYSSCHWCHVMERESFEDIDVAGIMNNHFVCIKVDREERPDIDQVYMNAVQLRTGQGGWPLNCFALADGRPVYGGTYFPKSRWLEILDGLSAEYQRNKPRFLDYAHELTHGVAQSELIPINMGEMAFSAQVASEMVRKWKRNFDFRWGGDARAPKFPMPSNCTFLLKYSMLAGDMEVNKHMELTLEQMAMGGIYDQIGGGFARYSTDAEWKVPHFEKMLYDNAQLIALYAKAFRHYKKPLFEHVITHSIDFLYREMCSQRRLMYSALDADSEGVEGKFYVWTKEDLRSALSTIEFEWICRIYEIDGAARWEHSNNILVLRKSPSAWANELNMTTGEFLNRLDDLNGKLLQIRNSRIKPDIDDKSLTSWNAMTVTALTEAHKALPDRGYIQKAKELFNSLLKHRLRVDGSLWHSGKNEMAYIDGFLDDYAFMVEAGLALFELTGIVGYLDNCLKWMDFADKQFSDIQTGLYYYTPLRGEKLIARKMEISDNVIPSANAVMAENLLRLGRFTQKVEYSNRSAQMLHHVQPNLTVYPSGYAHWGGLMLAHTFPFYEIAIIGKNAEKIQEELLADYIPQCVATLSTIDSELPLFNQRFIQGETRIFVCVNNTCLAPATTVEQARVLLNF